MFRVYIFILALLLPFQAYAASEEMLDDCIMEADEILLFAEMFSKVNESVDGRGITGDEVAGFFIAANSVYDYKRLLKDVAAQKITVSKMSEMLKALDNKLYEQANLITEMVDEGLANSYSVRAKANYISSCTVGFDNSIKKQSEMIKDLENQVRRLTVIIDDANLPKPTSREITAEVGAKLARTIESCWSPSPGDPGWADTITVGFKLSPEGRVEDSSLRLIASNGTKANTRGAFQRARRAILKCQRYFKLHASDIKHLQEFEMVFDPSKGVHLKQ